MEWCLLEIGTKTNKWANKWAQQTMDLTGKIPENLQKVYISQGKEKEFLVDGLLKKKKVISNFWIITLLKYKLNFWKCKLRIKCLSKSWHGISWTSPRPANGVGQGPMCLFLVWHINNLVRRGLKSSFRTGLPLAVNKKQMLKKREQLWEVIDMTL